MTRRRAPFKLTCLITVQLHWTIVYFRHGLNLNVIPVHVLLPLARYVARNVLRKKLRKVLSVLGLIEVFTLSKAAHYNWSASTHNVIHGLLPNVLVHVLVAIQLQ